MAGFRLSNPIPSDDALPALAAMLGDEAAAIIAAAWGDPAEQVVNATPTRVSWRPGISATVQYRVRVAGDAEERTTGVVAATGPALPEALVVGFGGARAALWRLEDDPYLPGLRLLLDPVQAGNFMERTGVGQAAAEPVLRAYRPGRRAVVEIRTGDRRIFAKVVRPARVARLQRRHAHLAEHLPVPRSLGSEPALGVVFLEALPGLTLRETFRQEAESLPDPGAIATLLDAMPLVTSRKAPTPAASAIAHAKLLRRLVPAESPLIDSITAAFTAIPADGPLVPVHGDLYESQLLVDDGRFSGLLDVDTVGLGARADDWATLIGHLDLWASIGRKPERVREYARQTLALADTLVDPRHLRLRIAAVILGLATGPFRVQVRDWPAMTASRLARSGRWVESAEGLPG